jgi:hypothetical protein
MRNDPIAAILPTCGSDEISVFMTTFFRFKHYSISTEKTYILLWSKDERSTKY